MARREDPEEPGKAAVCQKCGLTVTQAQIQRCPWCFKDFCGACRFPRGAADYCGRPCAEAMFHGGDDEDGAEDE
jgi:hypothetical protein